MVDCKLPHNPPVITMAHGGGGRAMARLLEEVVFANVRSEELNERHDSAVLTIERNLAINPRSPIERDAPRLPPRIAFTTDTYVVTPRFFPGGDIGKLAVFGTVNDLAMAGAMPLALSLALLLEEGFPIDELSRILTSVQEACNEADVRVVTGDTKVTERGKGDGLYITTAGIGVVRQGCLLAPNQIREGDALIVSRDIGRHGAAILSVREHLSFEPAITSDCSPLAAPMLSLLDAGIDVHAGRDLTRGGLGGSLCELAMASHTNFLVRENDIPVSPAVSGACELTGLDALYLACEGAMVLFVPEDQASWACALLRKFPACINAQIIGNVVGSGEGEVELQTAFGGSRRLTLPTGAELPRIC